MGKKKEKKDDFNVSGPFDHAGNQYENLKEMCCAYHITEDLFHERIDLGWKLKDVLTTPIGGVPEGKSSKSGMDETWDEIENYPDDEEYEYEDGDEYEDEEITEEDVVRVLLHKYGLETILDALELYQKQGKASKK